MSDKDEHKHDDADLAAYLDGSDGVSDAYRSLEQAQPPAQLDARILAAARGEGSSGERKSAGNLAVARLRGRLSLAASLVLGVIIGSQFPADLRLHQEAVTSREKAASQEDVAVALPDAPEVRSGLEAVSEFFSVAEDVATAVPSNPAARRSTQMQPETAGLSATDEIVVTGARLQRAEAPVIASLAAVDSMDYRQSVVLWLREIARLQEQLSENESAVLQQQLEQEMLQFRQRYPTLALERELENLRRTGSGN